MGIEILLISFFVSGAIILLIFLRFILSGKLLQRNVLSGFLEMISLFIAPLAYLVVFDFGQTNDCCSDSAVFSAEHRPSIYVIILLSLIAYYYSAYRNTIATPIVELLVNIALLTGIVLNVIIGIHTNEWMFGVAGNVPVILLGILMMARNHRKLMEHIQTMERNADGGIKKIAWKILCLKPLIKFPVLFVLCLPVLTGIALLLFLTGQKPDAMIRAFTDTYKHGFSQWDYKCANVECGGHFLCSVAAKGHAQFVRPIRLGVRNEQNILCNRQLLVSNAFEELLQHKCPALHKPLRKAYNQVGHFIHRYYAVFNNKWICDVIYCIMKPAEWFFLFTLYLFDKNPENRIARQYINKADKQRLQHYLG